MAKEKRFYAEGCGESLKGLINQESKIEISIFKRLLWTQWKLIFMRSEPFCQEKVGLIGISGGHKETLGMGERGKRAG